MPGAVPRTSTFALTNVTMPYAYILADNGVNTNILQNEALIKGINVYKGKITYKSIAEELNHDYYPIRDVLENK